MLCRARFCNGKSFVSPYVSRVCDVEVHWSYGSDFFENNNKVGKNDLLQRDRPEIPGGIVLGVE